MSASLPAVLDVWRMVAARRSFEGRLPLSAFGRLGESLTDAEGEVRYTLDFDRDALKIATLDLHIEADLPLECQRTLQRFLHPVRIDQRLGLIASESQEASLPGEYEPVLVGEDGAVNPLDLIEDELILAIPVVPVAPGTEPAEQEWPAPQQSENQEERPNPFAALSVLKERKH
ncbi:YceD family protein [Coralloluteibacterium thermophilus]|uniref:Large ribosomal RNA subunit accumulation protein YceD n=1 Tax=Coralloluteibacterium thermophilum TaxID=2707049 RepID=A0ABV9NGL5_9GAMM